MEKQKREFQLGLMDGWWAEKNVRCCWFQVVGIRVLAHAAAHHKSHILRARNYSETLIGAHHVGWWESGLDTKIGQILHHAITMPVDGI